MKEYLVATALWDDAQGQRYYQILSRHTSHLQADRAAMRWSTCHRLPHCAVVRRLRTGQETPDLGARMTSEEIIACSEVVL